MPDHLKAAVVAGAPRKPVQARARRTEQALLNAMEKLLAKKSIADLTVAEIADEAQLTTGAIYRRFKGKQDLLRAAFERFLARTEASLKQEDLAGRPLSDRARVRRVLDAAMRITLANSHFMRAASVLNDLPSFELMRRARSLSADRLAAQLRQSTFTEAELRSRCRFVLRVATATFRDTFLAGHGASDALQDTAAYLKGNRRALTALVSDLTEMACAYLAIE